MWLLLWEVLFIVAVACAGHAVKCFKVKKRGHTVEAVISLVITVALLLGISMSIVYPGH